MKYQVAFTSLWFLEKIIYLTDKKKWELDTFENFPLVSAFLMAFIWTSVGCICDQGADFAFPSPCSISLWVVLSAPFQHRQHAAHSTVISAFVLLLAVELNTLNTHHHFFPLKCPHPLLVWWSFSSSRFLKKGWWLGVCACLTLLLCILDTWRAA